MVPGIRENRLVTTGPYRFSRNPLYVTLIFLMIPGLALALNSWLVVTASIIACILFRIYIHEEEELLERIFGEEFRSYKARTGRYCRLL
jgi:protein-S-isoprenylcysteine O-methyltransferase Ste14